MVLKDNAEIANVVSRALLDYANKVQNGLVSPYRNLLESNMAVVVLTITDAGAISVAPIPEATYVSSGSPHKPIEPIIVESNPMGVYSQDPVEAKKAWEEQIVSISETVVAKPKRVRKKKETT